MILYANLGFLLSIILRAFLAHKNCQIATNTYITSIKKDKLKELSSTSDEEKNVDIELTIDEIKTEDDHR